MVNVKVRIKGLENISQLPKQILKAVKKASKTRLKYLALQQQNAILKQQTPSGASQKPNSEKTKEKKARLLKKGKINYNKPLYKTGQLANSLNWKVGAGKNAATLKPPTTRKRIVYILMAKGYKLVFNQLPNDFEQKLDQEIQKELDRSEKKIR